MSARMEFVEFWARYVRSHSDKDWSIQQNKVINSQFPSTMTKRQFLEMKMRA